MRGSEVVDGGGGGQVGDNMHGWASVGHGVDICLSYNIAHSKKDKKKKKNRQTKHRKTKRESRVTKDHITKYVVSLY